MQERAVVAVIRLGLVGAGSVAQAIHIPTVARLGGDVCVTEVMDVDPELARVGAGPHGARATSTLEEMLAGDGIDVAVIGSPDAFHLAQIEAVCAAGVSGIMAEKPVVLTRAEAQRMAAAVTAAGAGGTLELLARTGGTWRPDWAVDIWGRDLELSLDFPPTYVHAGSGSARLRGPDGRDHVFGPYPTNGYVGEWRELLAVLGGQPPRYDVQYLVDDVAYAIDLADHAVAALEDETAAAAR